MTASASCHSEPGTEVVTHAVELDVALVGRPNAGKSSLYNAITGGHARVGNFPGITVDLLEADVPLPAGGTARIVDLPGVYSLASTVDEASDEGQARAALDRLLAGGKPLLFAQVIDATQLALGLRLTAELLGRGAPLLVVITQRDVLEGLGRTLDAARLERELGVPVLAVSARDADVRARTLAAIERLGRVARQTGGGSAKSFDAEALARSAIGEKPDLKKAELRRRERTAKADAVLLHPVVGPLLFLVIMSALFSAVFLISDPASSLLDKVVHLLSTRITAVFGDGWFTSLVCDGILGGAGTVLAFLPQIVILTVALELVDASGYLARGAFLVDRVLRLAGLGGRSFVPLLTAHACAIPAISATRIIRDPKQRLRTMLVLPLMTCAARLPTYGLLIAAFFAGQSALTRSLIFVGLYLAGIVFGFLASLVIGKTVQRGGRSLPLVLEMPAYRVPQPRVVAQTAWRASKRFVREVGTVIVAASIVLWVLLKVPAPGAPPPVAGDPTPARTSMQHSIAATVGRTLEPVTKPIGFDWRINVGLVGAFGARELMVSTLGVIFGIENADDDSAPLAREIRDAKGPQGQRAYSPATALSLLAFFVLACQCMSTIAALRRETKSLKWPAFVLGYTYVLAYVVSFVVYQGSVLLGLG